ncbi:hypothetical protein ABKA04_004892 [Annulohypoxylon sp. FPYF3050]
MKDEMNTDKATNPGEQDDVESLPDPSLAISNTSADNDHTAPAPKFKSKLPLAVRVNKDPPYPPPSFPLPAPPPGESRRPRTREHDQSFSNKSYAHSSLSKAHQYSKRPKDKPSNQLTQQPTPDSSIAGKQQLEATSAQKATTETSQSSFPTFGGSSLGSSSKYTDSLELLDVNKSIQTSEAGPKVPVVVVSNPDSTGSQADLVQAPEMPTETGSPIFYGNPRRLEEAEEAEEGMFLRQGTLPRKVVLQAKTGATDNKDTSADGQTAPFTLPPIPRLTPFTASKAPQEVVDATAELRKLALEPTPPGHGRHKSDSKGGQGIPRSHYGMGNLAEANVLSYGDTVIRHPQVPAPSRGTDRIHPSAVVAASTPSRLLTPDFIRSMIHDEVIQFQHDLRTSIVTRPGALAMLSRAVEASSDDTEIEAQNAAAEGRIFANVTDAIAREDRLDQFGGSLGDDPFYDTGNHEAINHMSSHAGHGYTLGQNHGYSTSYPYPGVFSPMQPHHQSPYQPLPHSHPYPVLPQPSNYSSYYVPPPTSGSDTPSQTYPQVHPPIYPQPQQPAPQQQATQQVAPPHPQPAPGARAAAHPAVPFWAPPPSENQVVVRPAPGPFLYAGADPEEMKRKDEEKRQKRLERERDRKQKKEEKNKQKANEEAQKELRKSMGSRDSTSVHGSIGASQGSGRSDASASIGASVGTGVGLKPKPSFGGSLRRAFNAFKKPASNAPGPASVAEEEEAVVRDSEERGRTRERGLGHLKRGHGNPGHDQLHPGPGPGSSHGQGHGLGHGGDDRRKDDHPQDK